MCGAVLDGGAYEILARHRVTCAFLVPHVLRRIRADPPSADAALHLRAVMTGGERLGHHLRADIQRCLRTSLNDDFGLTEGTHLAVGCDALYKTPAGAIGRAVPGRRVAIIDAHGNECPTGTSGEIVVCADDPIVMLGYWNQPELTAHKLRDGWLHPATAVGLTPQAFCGSKAARTTSSRSVGCWSAQKIETVICAHPDVLECGIATGSSTRDGDAGMAYVHLHPPGRPPDSTRS